MTAAPLIYIVDDDESHARVSSNGLLGAVGYETRAYRCTGEVLASICRIAPAACCSCASADFLEKLIEPKALLAAILSALTRENSIRAAQSEKQRLCERLSSLSARASNLRSPRPRQAQQRDRL